MALLWSLRQVCILRQVPKMLLRNMPLIFYSQGEKSVQLEIDVLDRFTSQLMQTKIEKWCREDRKLHSKIERAFDGVSDAPDVKILPENHLEVLLQDCIDNSHAEKMKEILEACISDGKTPPATILINCLTLCAQSGYRETIQSLQELCTNLNPDVLVQNSDFRHFLAEAIWVRGNVPKAIELFEDVYRENVYLRRRIRLRLKQLIVDLVSNRSEAVLWTTIKFAERIQAEFGDLYPLGCIWQTCFISEWFTDQCIALQLLDRNSGLCKSVINRIPYVVFVSLKAHRTEVVYRLLELLLKFELRHQYAQVLAALLDYQFRCGDYNSCSEIIHWAIENDVPLPENQHIRLINLLLNEKLRTPFAPLKTKTNETKPYSLKF